MAQSKKRTKRKTNSRKKTQKNSLIRSEIKLIVALALGILLELSVFGIIGKVGNAVAYFMFGMFGLISYVLPILIFLGVAFLISNSQNRKSISKFISAVILILAFISLLQLVSHPFDENMLISSYYTDSGDNRYAGGLIGGLISKGLASLIGIVGAYIVDIVLIIIMIVIITEKSFINGVKKGSNKVYEAAKDNTEKFKEEKKERQIQEKKARRTERKIKGVPTNIELKDMNLTNDDITEIDSESLNNKVFRGPVDIAEITPQEDYIEEEIIPKQKTKYQAKSTRIEPEEIEEAIVKIEHNNIDESNYNYPPKSFLANPKNKRTGGSTGGLNETARKLQQTLHNFGVKVTITDVSQGPSVTRYELQPEMGTKVSRITSLADDIKLNLAASDIRIEAPIPGKAAVGIEVPNDGREPVLLKELLENPEMKNHPSKISFAAGKDISGKVVIADIAKMPHMLVAGTTGSGKSVFLNSIIMTILYRAKPSEVKLIIIDPKVVEFAIYNGIPHLLQPVMTDPRSAAATLSWAVAEMSRRYQILAENNVRDFKSYNDKVDLMKGDDIPEKIPQIIIVIDELADLMMVAAKAVEDSICRLAQLARAAGIHLIVATQRPSVDVVTGLIKANVPSRVALMVSSGTDSRTIIDMNGAEKLLGDGDMLFAPSGYVKPVRVQGAYVSENEVSKVVKFLKDKYDEAGYDESITQHISQGASEPEEKNTKTMSGGRDILFEEAAFFCIEKEKASASMLQRRFNIGFNRAARIIDQLSEVGVVGGDEGSKPRKIIMNAEEFQIFINE